MNSIERLRVMVIATGLLLSTPLHAHDPEASWTTARLGPDTLELEINFAAVSAWTLVEDELAPGLEFVFEEFEAVGKPLLLRLAALLQEVTVDGKPVAPSRVEVVIVDDDFDFRLVFPLPSPSGSMLRIRELYLDRISPDYRSNINVLNTSGERITAKIMDADDPSIFVRIPSRAAGFGSQDAK